jgi:hypothetical protein
MTSFTATDAPATNGDAAAEADAAPGKKDMTPAELFQQKLFGMLGGAMTSSLIALGDTLGIYKTMKQLGRLSSAELAEACNLSERFVREWLHQQVDPAEMVSILITQPQTLLLRMCALGIPS